jgi:hypothetical protein
MSEDFFEGYKPLFELGLFDEDPAIRIVGEFEICPTSLAALVTALFETVMKTVPDENQIEYEEKFNHALKILMQERFQYDVVMKFPDDNDDED